MASLAQGRECFGSRCGGKTGMAAGVRGDQQLSKGLLGRKKERKPTCGGDGTKAPLPSVGRYTAQAKCKRLVEDSTDPQEVLRLITGVEDERVKNFFRHVFVVQWPKEGGEP